MTSARTYAKIVESSDPERTRRIILNRKEYEFKWGVLLEVSGYQRDVVAATPPRGYVYLEGCA